MVITTEKEFGQALKEEKDYIEIEGNLAKTTLKIKATGKIAWSIAITGIAATVGFIIFTIASAGASSPVTAPGIAATSTVAVGILGASATMSAISIAIAGGGTAVLWTLRKYKIKEQSENRVVLVRK